jgi:hypothetical protein
MMPGGKLRVIETSPSTGVMVVERDGRTCRSDSPWQPDPRQAKGCGRRVRLTPQTPVLFGLDPERPSADRPAKRHRRQR